jgi:hypothetical protein
MVNKVHALKKMGTLTKNRDTITALQALELMKATGFFQSRFSGVASNTL